MPASRPDQRLNLLISLTFLRFLNQADRRGEAFAVGLGQFLGTGDEADLRHWLPVDILHDAARPGREADAEDGADVGVAH